MKIKKYLVNSIDEALTEIKKDLGNEAYILSTKKIITNGALNLSKKTMVEVTAAVENSRNTHDNISKNLLDKKYGIVGLENKKVIKTPINKNNVNYENKEFNFNKNKKKGELGSNIILNDNYGTIDKMSFLKDELLPLKQEVEEIKLLLRKNGTDIFDNKSDYKGIFMDVFLNLIENGVERKLARKIVDTLTYQITGKSYNNKEINKYLISIITALLGNPSPIKVEKGKRKVIALVGPTGAGKTTTIAKLASYYKLMESKRVALITNDNYRIGAEAHLSTYAKILNIPFYSVYDRKDIRFRLKELTEYDIAFIDTTGRSTGDNKGLFETKNILDEIPKDELDTMLILSASTKTEDLKNIYEKYSLFNPDKFIFSKLDETLTLGNLFNLKVSANIPAAYYTTGQQVPEDIEIAYPRRLAAKILSVSKNGGKGYESSSRVV